MNVFLFQMCILTIGEGKENPVVLDWNMKFDMNLLFFKNTYFLFLLKSPLGTGIPINTRHTQCPDLFLNTSPAKGTGFLVEKANAGVGQRKYKMHQKYTLGQNKKVFF